MPLGCRVGVGAQGFQDTGSCSQKPQRHGEVGGPGIGQGSAGLRGQRGGASALPQGAFQEQAVLGRGGRVCLFRGPRAWRCMCAFIRVTPLSILTVSFDVRRPRCTGTPLPPAPCLVTTASGPQLLRHLWFLSQPLDPTALGGADSLPSLVGAWPAHLCANQNGTPGRGPSDCRPCVPPMHPHPRPRPCEPPSGDPTQERPPRPHPVTPAGTWARGPGGWGTSQGLGSQASWGLGCGLPHGGWTLRRSLLLGRSWCLACGLPPPLPS